MDTERLITPADVAKEKGVTRAAVYLAIKTRHLRAETLFGRVLIDKSAAAQWTPVKSNKERGMMGGRPKSAATNAKNEDRLA